MFFMRWPPPASHARRAKPAPRNCWISSDCSALADRPARRLSGGEQQRLALARALAKDPEILFLDEPTASLDPAATKALEDIIRGVAARGIKVVMSTHDLGEARRLGGDIVLLHRGRLIEIADAPDFLRQSAHASRRAASSRANCCLKKIKPEDKPMNARRDFWH